jgi:hypothetical protein
MSILPKYDEPNRWDVYRFLIFFNFLTAPFWVLWAECDSPGAWVGTPISVFLGFAFWLAFCLEYKSWRFWKRPTVRNQE